MNKTVLVIAFVACLAALSAVSRANLIDNGSFEYASENFTAPTGSFDTLYQGSTAIRSWKVTAGSVDWINSYWDASNGSRSIDMNGLWQNGALALSLAQQLTLTPGQKYLLSFDMAGNTDGLPTTKTLDVTIQPTFPNDQSATQTYTFDSTGRDHQNMGWTKQNLYFYAGSGATTLTFTARNFLPDGSPSAFGPAIDNVCLVAVPVPAAIVLGAMGLGLVGWARKRMA